MKQYELLYIIPSAYTDDEIENIQNTVEKLLTKQGGEVSRNENLGKIKLAYPIKKEKYGTYILVHFSTESENIAQINRILGLTDEVLRHMLVAMPEGASDRKYELTGYVPPYSPKGFSVREQKQRKKKKKKVKSRGRTPSKRKEEKEKREAEKKKAQPEPKRTAKKPPKKESSNEDEDEKKTLSIEELDERLDEILEGGLSDEV